MATSKNKPVSTKSETTEERNARYAKTKKEKISELRKVRKQEKLDGNASNRRLSFMTNIFSAMGITYKDAGKLCGRTQQAMSYIFSVADDCKLTVAESILDALGLELKVAYKKDDAKQQIINLGEKKTGKNDGVAFKIEGDFIGAQKWAREEMPQYMRNCQPGDRLYFLASYLPTTGMSITTISRLSGIEFTSFRLMFANDDIRISHIFNIAKATGAEIIWTVNKKKEAKK